MWSPADIDALYRKARPAVLLRCRALLRDDAEARDVTQEVFLHLLDHPDEYRGDAAPTTYLYAIATNRALSRVRARVVREKKSWRDAVTTLVEAASPNVDPEELTAARELLADALDAADEQTTLILVYHFLDGLSQGEIAELVGLSRVTVNQRIQKFRERTREKAEAEP